MAGISLPRKSRTDRMQLISGVSMLQRSLPRLVLATYALEPEHLDVMSRNESRFCLQQLDHSQHRVKARRGRTEWYADCYSNRVAAFGEGSVIVWGHFSFDGLKKGLSSSVEILNAERYPDEILQPHIYTVWDWTLSSKMTTPALTERRLSETTKRIWEWRGWKGLPEHWWDQLGKAVCARVTNTATLADLCRMLVEERVAFSQQCVNKLVTSVRRRCETGCVWFLHILLRPLIF